MEYELIKKYPGSPDLGFIASPKSPGDYYVNSNWIYPEKYPEFWEKVVEFDYEILRSCPIEGSIYSVKRISDSAVFSVGDKVNMFKGASYIKALRILSNGEFVIDFDNKCSVIGVQNISKVKESIFVTYDGVELFGGVCVYGVTDDMQLTYTSIATEDNVKRCRVFAKKENAEKYILDNKPKRLYTEDEMVKALENWGMCRVDISYVNEFLNK